MSPSAVAETTSELIPADAGDAPLLPETGDRAAGLSTGRIAALNGVACLFPMAAGLAVYGWRAAISVALVLGSTMASAWLWQRVGRRGRTIRIIDSVVLGLMLCLTLPPHLASMGAVPGNQATAALWPILPAAGIVLVIFAWMVGGTQRIQAVLLTHLILVVLFPTAMDCTLILRRDTLVTGDLLNAAPPADPTLAARWIDPSPAVAQDAIVRVSAAERLTAFTSGRELPERAWVSMESLLRDRLPPLEDVFVAGDPRSIGTASAVLVVIGGLFLLYRGLIDYRIPVLVVLAAWITLLVLPVPIVITEEGPDWRWLPLRPSAATWGVAMTFANYEILASPLVLVALFMATSPSIRPMSRRWRPAYAVAVGVSAAAMQLYIGAAIGPYVALLLVGLLVPLLDGRYSAQQWPSAG